MSSHETPRDSGYQTALDYLYGRINYERTPPGSPASRDLNLDRMRDLLARLSNPQDSFRAIHIAGTKGKGSTAEMAAAVMRAAGYSVGLYTSPHLERLEERINVNGLDCSREELVDLVGEVQPVAASMDQQAERDGTRWRPTFFEITTAMAMLHFARRAVDVAVLEVGMGGRLDSTNVCQPAITVITTISFDHVQQLGNTLAAIAAEKAGIVKPGVPLVCGVRQAEPREVIQRIAAERHAPAYFLGEHFDFEYQAARSLEAFEQSGGTIEFSTCRHGRIEQRAKYPLAMAGYHQALNASVTLAALHHLKLAGWNIPEMAIRQGLATARCRARVEVVGRHPTVILDTAHNVASIEALLDTINQSFANRQRVLIFAASRDKDVRGMLELLLPHFPSIILTQYLDNPRAIPPEELRAIVNEALATRVPCPPPQVLLCPSPVAAWRHAQSVLSPEHLLCITGSFFLAAEMRSLIPARHAVTVTN